MDIKQLKQYSLVQIIDPTGLELSHLQSQLAESLPHVVVVSADVTAHISLLRETVIEEVAIGLEQRGLPHEDMQLRCEKILEASGLLHLAEQHPAKLSGGQMRRLAISSVAILEPATLIIEAAFSGLDPHSRRLIRNLLAEITSNVIVLDSAPAPELQHTFFYERGVLSATAAAFDLSLPPAVTCSTHAPIELENITASRGLRKARWWRPAAQPPSFTIGPISLRAHPGEVVWLRGANGSGKTTLLRGLAGLDNNPPPPVPTSLALQQPHDQVISSTIADFIDAPTLVDELGFSPSTHPLDLPTSQLRLAQIAAVTAQQRPLLLFDEPDVYLTPTDKERAHRLFARALGNEAALIITCHDPSFVEEIRAYATVREVNVG